MEDEEIIRLYQTKSEGAIAASERKYGSYCMSIALHVLGSEEDARECVNDVWFRAWTQIPQKTPHCLQAYLAKLTRSLAIDRWRRSHSEKRGGGRLPAALEELDECIPSAMRVERIAEQRELAELLQRFTDSLPREERSVFVCRYWYFDTVPEISRRFGFSRSKVSSMLFRIRKQLKSYLKECGYSHESL